MREPHAQRQAPVFECEGKRYNKLGCRQAWGGSAYSKQVRVLKFRVCGTRLHSGRMQNLTHLTKKGVADPQPQTLHRASESQAANLKFQTLDHKYQIQKSKSQIQNSKPSTGLSTRSISPPTTSWPARTQMFYSTASKPMRRL